MKYTVGTEFTDSAGRTWKISSSDKHTDSYYLESGLKLIYKTEKVLEGLIKNGGLVPAKVAKITNGNGNMKYNIGDRFKASDG